MLLSQTISPALLAENWGIMRLSQ